MNEAVFLPVIKTSRLESRRRHHKTGNGDGLTRPVRQKYTLGLRSSDARAPRIHTHDPSECLYQRIISNSKLNEKTISRDE